MFTTATPGRFTAAFRLHPAGVALITADAGTGPVALTATSVSSVSVDPPMLMFSVSDASSSAPTLRCADTVVIHLLGADERHLAKLGASSGIDRFADTALWRRLPTGEAYFPQARVRIRARVAQRVRAGTSCVLIAQALEAAGPGVDGEPARTPLVYHDRTWHGLDDRSKLG
ncbi:flavin reductase family protein [Rhodococcus phenolicus]|uniref:flavin reductase family protein n=1 Tax=Rhodococcus phenolicus TaxID=263849 RepID=UPI000833F660|nr:flavin reductase family protein [Rhodococcus phenolicus]